MPLNERSRSLNIAHSISLQVVDKKLDVVAAIETDTHQLIVDNVQKFENFEMQSRQSSFQQSEYLSRLEKAVSRQGKMIASIHSMSAASFAGSVHQDTFISASKQEQDEPIQVHKPCSFMKQADRNALPFGRCPKLADLREANLGIAKILPDSIFAYDSLVRSLQNHASFRAIASSNLDGLDYIRETF